MGAAKITPRKLEIDDALVDKIHRGVQKTFDALFDISPMPGPYRVEVDFKHQADLSGMIGLTQDKIEGSLIVSFSKETIFKVLAKIYNRDFTTIDRSVSEGVAEIVNIVFGVVKAQLNSSGFTLMQSLPSLVMGAQHSMALASRPGAKTLIIPFGTPYGPFQVLVQIYPESMINIKG